jgi:CubicO group peptidase (beta-lactamase class C family)
MKLKHSNLYFLIAILFFSFDAFSQKTEDVKTALKGFDDYVEQVMNDWQVPGLAIGIVQNGKIVYTKGYGYRNKVSKMPVTENTLFGIGSCTKAFTAATVAQAVDNGRLDLDKPIKTYIPSFKMENEYVTNNLTLRDILCHRSGLPRHDMVWYGSDKTREELVASLAVLESTADFRTAWQYQNLLYATAGYVVGQVNKTTWEAYLQEEILKPLRMSNTNFSVEEMQKQNDYAMPYDLKNEEIRQIPFRSIDAIGPAGSINSNVKDMANWLKMQLSNGKFEDKEIVSINNFKSMHQPQMTMPGSLEEDELFFRSYGMGWMLTSYRGHFRSEHGGNIDGFSANVGLLPRDGIGVVILTNMNGTSVPSIIRNNVFDRFLGLEQIDWNLRFLDTQAKSKQVKAEIETENDPIQKQNTIPTHATEEYLGTYEHPAYGKLEITADNGQLELIMKGELVELEHYHYDVFKAKNGLLESTKFAFEMNKDGDIHQISASLQIGVNDIVFERQPEISDFDINIYLGKYELAGQVMNFYKEGDLMKLDVPGQPTYTLVPQKEHQFSIKGLTGFAIIFKVKKGKPAESVIFNQPNGVFTAKRR